jgi:hypothetical protein
LALHSPIDIALERRKRINQATVEYGNGAKTSSQPRLPLGFVDGYTCEGVDAGVLKRECGWERYSHGTCLFVDEVGGGDFAGAWGDAHSKRAVRVLLRRPSGDGIESCADDRRRNLNSVSVRAMIEGIN